MPVRPEPRIIGATTTWSRSRHFAAMKRDTSLRVLELAGLGVSYVALNTQHAPFNDVRVRRDRTEADEQRHQQGLQDVAGGEAGDHRGGDDAEQELGCTGGDPIDRQHPGKECRAANDEQHAGGGPHRFAAGFEKCLP